MVKNWINSNSVNGQQCLNARKAPRSMLKQRNEDKQRYFETRKTYANEALLAELASYLFVQHPPQRIRLKYNIKQNT